MPSMPVCVEPGPWLAASAAALDEQVVHAAGVRLDQRQQLLALQEVGTVAVHQGAQPGCVLMGSPPACRGVKDWAA